MPDRQTLHWHYMISCQILHFIYSMFTSIHVYSIKRNAVLSCWNKQKTETSLASGSLWLIDGKYYATWKGPCVMNWIRRPSLWLPDPWPPPSPPGAGAGQWWNAAAWGWWVSSQSEARAEYFWPIRAVCSWGKQSGAQCRDFLKAEQFTEVWVVAGLTKEKPVLLVLTN